ncbi:unnamed protein product, partial [Staurois parvus]
WYKAVVNSLVPCDLCDHSQIPQVASNDVKSDWPISDHMIGTSHRGPVRRSVFHCVREEENPGCSVQNHSQVARTRRGQGGRL